MIAIEVWCPTCKAQSEQPCTTITGAIMVDIYHQARRRYARKVTRQ